MAFLRKGSPMYVHFFVVLVAVIINKLLRTIKVRIMDGLKDETIRRLEAVCAKSKGKGKGNAGNTELTPSNLTQPIFVVLKFKKYAFDSAKKMVQ